ncbi:MAG: hypothetical protein KDB46_06935 [Solirubrobacterales bacterium]|nr:hypothetical protein [Solirubrobacterales bacterium]
MALVTVLAVVAINAPKSSAGGSGCVISNIGTVGNDILCGTNAADSMNGGAGNDQMFGRGGNDSMVGSSGNDFMAGGDGNDTITGSTNRDSVHGQRGDDILIGGSGAQDVASGGPGNDQIRFRDGEVDQHAVCNEGADSADLDLVDAPAIFSATVTGGCETVTVGAVNEGPNVSISTRTPGIAESGKVPTRLHCPRSLTDSCRGELTVGHALKRQGTSNHYAITPGTSKRIKARLSSRDRRRLSHRGKLVAIAVSVETGEFGDKTTAQTLRLTSRG